MRRTMWSEQLNTSRNLRESRWTLTKRIGWALWFWCYACWLALREMGHTHLGSRVRYRGEVWTISNWANSPSSTIVKGDRRLEYVSRDELTPVVTPRELWHRFTTHRRWWMGYWHGIAVNGKLLKRTRTT